MVVVWLGCGGGWWLWWWLVWLWWWWLVVVVVVVVVVVGWWWLVWLWWWLVWWLVVVVVVGVVVGVVVVVVWWCGGRRLLGGYFVALLLLVYGGSLGSGRFDRRDSFVPDDPRDSVDHLLEDVERGREPQERRSASLAGVCRPQTVEHFRDHVSHHAERSPRLLMFVLNSVPCRGLYEFEHLP